MTLHAIRGRGRRAGRAGFTLIEMLAVIGVIMLMGALLFPVLGMQKKKAKVARTRNDIDQIVGSWKAYALQYGYYPPGITKMDSAAVQILAGVDTAADKNPWGTVFLDVRDKSEAFHDPWIDDDEPTKHIYHVMLDDDLDGSVVVGSETVKREVAVWSDGPDGVGGTKDDICNWK